MNRAFAYTLAALAVAALVVFHPVRLALWWALCGACRALLALVAAVLERRRSLERPARQLPPDHVWRVTLYVELQGRMRALASGTVTGPWKTAGEVEAEAMRRWVAKYDWPKAGRLCARAEPVTVRAA